MTRAETDKRIIEALRSKHGISEEQATQLLVMLDRSRALDIIDADTGLPVALLEDDESDDGDEWNERDGVSLNQR